jgi:hypothetical protein
MRVLLYGVLLRSAQYASQMSWENEKKYIREYRGIPVMNAVRAVWKKLDLTIDKRKHFYSDIQWVGKSAPDADARAFYEFLKAHSINTVPISIRGGDNKILGPRTQGGRATAIFGGPVETSHDDKTMMLVNFAKPGHFFAGGYVIIRVFEEEDNVYSEFIGFGKNNFAWFNEWFGSKLFKGIMNFNITRYNLGRYTE